MRGLSRAACSVELGNGLRDHDLVHGQLGGSRRLTRAGLSLATRKQFIHNEARPGLGLAAPRQHILIQALSISIPPGTVMQIRKVIIVFVTVIVVDIRRHREKLSVVDPSRRLYICRYCRLYIRRCHHIEHAAAPGFLLLQLGLLLSSGLLHVGHLLAPKEGGGRRSQRVHLRGGVTCYSQHGSRGQRGLSQRLRSWTTKALRALTSLIMLGSGPAKFRPLGRGKKAW